MRRRVLLCSLGALAGGCLAAPSGSPGATATPTPSGTPTAGTGPTDGRTADPTTTGTADALGPPADAYRVTGFSVETDSDRPTAVEFDARLLDARVAAGDRGAVELALTNAGEQRQVVEAGTVPPFGLVRATAVRGDGRFLLWRPYATEGCVQFTDRGIAACDIGTTTALAPGETVARRYELLPPGTDRRPDYTVAPGRGTYRVTGTVRYDDGTGGSLTSFSYAVRFDLDAA